MFGDVRGVLVLLCSPQIPGWILRLLGVNMLHKDTVFTHYHPIFQCLMEMLTAIMVMISHKIVIARLLIESSDYRRHGFSC